jgi:hypothetical protein
LDSVQHILTTRGNVFKQTENFYIFLDTYHDGQNANGFGVSIDNVQDDFKATSGGANIDGTWDAVWESKTSVGDKLWIAEFKIPYSAIRFPKAIKQDWTLDFAREIRRKKEVTSWCPTPPTTEAFVPKMNPLLGIENINPPARISISPYASSYYLAQGKIHNSAIKGGADVKYGISESFTLDMTLIPDFGQVASDQLVKNLSPYEIQYEERRPFFLEGADLFSKNNIFYSRRIGQTSDYFYQHFDNSLAIQKEPQQSKLINAFKLSGKTDNNISVGVLNALTNNMYVIAIDSNHAEQKLLYEPLTNYNITVLEKTLKNNAHIGFINTNVTRTSKGDDANVTGVDAKFFNKKNSGILASYGNRSSLYNATNVNLKTKNGYNAGVGIGKVTGMWQCSYNAEFYDDKYNPNELGYLSKNNFISQNFALKQIITKPFWKILKMTNMIYTERENNYASGKFSNQVFMIKTNMDWKNYLTLVSHIATKPMIQHDFYDARTSGYFVNIPAVTQARTYFSSDYRKTIAIDGSVNYLVFNEHKRNQFAFEFIPRIRPNRKLLIIYNYENRYHQNEKGFVTKDDGKIIFGLRNVREIGNSINLNYVVNNKTSAKLIARHYWSSGRYSKYYQLEKSGNLTSIPTNYDANFNFDAWSFDLIYTWQFAPGSLLTLAWKNVVNTEPESTNTTYFQNIQSTFNQPLSNSVSVKMLYYLDAGKWINKLKKTV